MFVEILRGNGSETGRVLRFCEQPKEEPARSLSHLVWMGCRLAPLGLLACRNERAPLIFWSDRLGFHPFPSTILARAFVGTLSSSWPHNRSWLLSLGLSSQSLLLLEQRSNDQLNMAEETHPLRNEWVLWEHKSAEKKDPSKWKENMKQLCEFSTVEDFWSYFNHLPRPSEVFFDGDCRKKVGPEEKTVEEYSLFKKGIEPEWGDPKNVIGGEWFCRQYFEMDVLDLYWQNLVMGIVGETIEDGVDEEDTYEDHINGARVVDKSRNFPMYRLEVWINTRDPKIRDRLRDRLVEIITDGQPPSRKMHPKFDWKDHSA